MVEILLLYVLGCLISFCILVLIFRDDSLHRNMKKIIKFSLSSWLFVGAVIILLIEELDCYKKINKKDNEIRM